MGVVPLTHFFSWVMHVIGRRRPASSRRILGRRARATWSRSQGQATAAHPTPDHPPHPIASHRGFIVVAPARRPITASTGKPRGQTQPDWSGRIASRPIGRRAPFRSLIPRQIKSPRTRTPRRPPRWRNPILATASLRIWYVVDSGAPSKGRVCWWRMLTMPGRSPMSTSSPRSDTRRCLASTPTRSQSGS